MDIGFLDDGGQSFFQPPRLQEKGEVAPLPQLGDAQLHGPSPGFPVAITVAVALDQPLGALLAMSGAGQAAHFQLHQTLRAIADHLAQKVSVRALLHQRPQVHHVVGHLRSSLGLNSQPKTTEDR